MEKAKNVRRAAKSAFTRSLNAGKMLLDSSRPPLDVRHAFDEVNAAHDNLIAKHEEHTMYLNDEEYPEAEHWKSVIQKSRLEEYLEFLTRIMV